MFCEIILVLVLFLDFPYQSKCSPNANQSNQVDTWARNIGNELQALGETITRYNQIQQKYKYLNARVGKKDPQALLENIKKTAMRMIDRKMDAIACIQRKAEDLAENFEFNTSAPFEYYSSKWSPVGNASLKVPDSLKSIAKMYKPMKLNNDTHFYNLAVDTNHSSVHVPTNIYDKEEAAAFAIQWSEDLDEVFYNNYKSDPALSWQYFGSASGIMRHYPGKQWEEHRKDLFDCRIRTWFIEAATCTKDVVILVDNSGSMDGMGHHIASLTASSILNTFSNNDYINVLNYSGIANYTIPCFAGKLVQATRENVNLFKEAIDNLKPEGRTYLDIALDEAITLLESYRKIRKCVNNNMNCNQAIMIITDGVTSNVSEVVMQRNHLNNGNNIPVRIFTYLVGKEVANMEEVKWIACANRGYYTYVPTLEQVTASVLQYISVVARPLVLQGTDHPISWTHAYVDITYDDKNDDVVNEPYRLLTSVAIPCYDTKINKMNDTRTAYLLGVAGTDVPLEEFSKITVPYKIGVNGYAFIVSGNGYVLMHPDLRPVFEGILKDNYNSIDLTQVEQHNDQLPAREIGDTLKMLREVLVNATESGSIHNIKLSYHYDDRKRISEEYFDYYYTPLETTPFTMCIAVPSTVSSVVPNAYGKFTLEVGDEIQKNKHTGQNFTTFFNGKWKIHPRWIYCKYHYLEGHEFDSPESELKHFLNKMYGDDFIWEGQYDEPESNTTRETVECGRKKKHHDRYYCDKELIQKLIFDAEVTNEHYSSGWKFTDRELALFKKFDASLRFVATMSGLTRWHYIFEEPNFDKNNTKRKEFGDIFPRAINEKWYKSAVLQRRYDPEAFVYSVPFDTAGKKDTIVTGSYAIFASDDGKEAPGSVVGFQFLQSKLSEKVMEISNKLSTDYCHNCSRCNGSLICYILDSSGYILVSTENDNDTGRFFGQVEGDILRSMLDEDIFRKITVFDYQALCRIDENADSGSSTIFTPLSYIQTAIHWLFIKMVYFLAELNIYTMLNAIPIYADDEYNEYDEDMVIDDDVDSISFDTSAEDAEDFMVQSKKDDYYPCETEITLFVLRQKLFLTQNFLEVDSPGVRKYYVAKIPYSNLIFVAVQPPTGRELYDKISFTTEPKQITQKTIFEYHLINSSLPCQKLSLNNLPRRRPEGCYNEHILEREIVDCGRAHHATQINLCLLLITVCVRLYL